MAGLYHIVKPWWAAHISKRAANEADLEDGPAYYSEKDKNRALIEDVRSIAEETERVKIEHGRVWDQKVLAYGGLLDMYLSWQHLMIDVFLHKQARTTFDGSDRYKKSLEDGSAARARAMLFTKYDDWDSYLKLREMPRKFEDSPPLHDELHAAHDEFRSAFEKLIEVAREDLKVEPRD